MPKGMSRWMPQQRADAFTLPPSLRSIWVLSEFEWCVAAGWGWSLLRRKETLLQTSEIMSYQLSWAFFSQSSWQIKLTSWKHCWLRPLLCLRLSHLVRILAGVPPANSCTVYPFIKPQATVAGDSASKLAVVYTSLHHILLAPSVGGAPRCQQSRFTEAPKTRRCQPGVAEEVRGPVRMERWELNWVSLNTDRTFWDAVVPYSLSGMFQVAKKWACSLVKLWPAG